MHVGTQSIFTEILLHLSRHLDIISIAQSGTQSDRRIEWIVLVQHTELEPRHTQHAAPIDVALTCAQSVAAMIAVTHIELDTAS